MELYVWTFVKLLLNLICYKTKKLMFPKGKTFVQDHRLGIKSSLAEISVTLLEPYTLYPLKDGMSVC